MKHTFLLTALSIILLAACKKKENRHYSYWYVNKDSFSTNDVGYDAGKAVQYIYTQSSRPNGFVLKFNLAYLPTTGSFLINGGQQNPEWIGFAVTYKGIGYVDPHNAYIQAGTLNGNPGYTLNTTWFYNHNNPSDSVLIRGVFNKP